jgi:exoribonuclease-2
VIDGFTLAEGRESPAVSLYLDVREADFAIEREHTVVERVAVARNIRLQEVQALDEVFRTGAPLPDVPHAALLHLLWRFAEAREAARGKPASTLERADYNFHVEGERIVISERTRGTPLDKLVSELMILANSTWGRLLDAQGVAAIYRVQSTNKVRMTVTPGEHQGLGVSHYAWTTSPLRRYVDLVNQWQLVSMLRGEAPPFERSSESLLGLVQEFDAAYSAYAEFQWRMERYWCLRWLSQEGVRIAKAEVVRDNLVRFRGLPFFAKVPSVPQSLPAGTEVDLDVLGVDLVDAEVRCRYRAPQT